MIHVRLNMLAAPRKMTEFSTMNWRPSASLNVIKKRADLLQQVRAFFHAREVMEVDTPSLSLAGNTEPNIENFTVQTGKDTYYLHTSPEFPMKRLLAAGSGSIYQICKVFRQEEAGRYHNPEFSMLEWYRVGFDHNELMDEVEELLKVVLTDVGIKESRRMSYQQSFIDHAEFDPLEISNEELVVHAARLGFEEVQGLTVNDRDAWLELLFDQIVAKKLAKNTIMFIYDYPESQAALARIRKEEGVAERFEVYINGIELANGFHELTDAKEQRQRFEQENAIRVAQGSQEIPMDERLLSALEEGLPECAGVALGIDRLLMLKVEASSIEDVINFSFDKV